MKHPWTAYAIVVLLAVGAGVAVAGPPDTAPGEATIVPPTNTEVTATTLSTTTELVPETTDVAEPDNTDARPGTTEPVSETTDVAEPDSTDRPTTTTTDASRSGTTEPDTRGSVPTDLPDRSELIVGVANGARVAGAAARNVVSLTEAGYVDVTPLDGIVTFGFTVVYYADGLEAAALRLAEDLDLLPEFVAPLANAPEVADLPPDTQLLAYIGIDRSS